MVIYLPQLSLTPELILILVDIREIFVTLIDTVVVLNFPNETLLVLSEVEVCDRD